MAKRVCLVSIPDGANIEPYLQLGLNPAKAVLGKRWLWIDMKCSDVENMLRGARLMWVDTVEVDVTCMVIVSAGVWDVARVFAEFLAGYGRATDQYWMEVGRTLEGDMVINVDVRVGGTPVLLAEAIEASGYIFVCAAGRVEESVGERTLVPELEKFMENELYAWTPRYCVSRCLGTPVIRGVLT